MNRPITLCNRCKEGARCCLNYDGDNCRRSRTVEPTNADRIRSMTDDELAEWYWWMLYYVQSYTNSWVALRTWLKEEYKE